MGELPGRSLHYSISGVSALVGRTVTVDQWAQEFRVPNRKVPGTFLTGEDVHRITGIEGKSWDPELFGDFSRIVAVGREAMRNAQVSPQQIDQVSRTRINVAAHCAPSAAPVAPCWCTTRSPTSGSCGTGCPPTASAVT